MNGYPPPSPFDAERLLNETFLDDVEIHPRLESTNDRALSLVEHGLPAAHLIIAESQLSGRGRGENRWWAESGALTFSLVVTVDRRRWPTERWPRIALTAGLAVCEALAEVVPVTDLGLKWPNDVFLASRKVCGILVEVPRGSVDRLVIGIGLNVNNSLQGAPAELQQRATSLIDYSGREHDLNDLLIGIINHTEALLFAEDQTDESLWNRWQSFCLLQGKTVALTSGSEEIIGSCQGLDPDGALILHTAAGPRHIYSGVVTRFD